MRNPTDRMIEKAVDIWCEQLWSPSFDNGDSSANGAFTSGLVDMLTESIMSKIDNMEERVEIFRKSLTKSLIESRVEGEYFDGYLSVDYDPCPLLAEAAKEADIHPKLFPCKSNVDIRGGFLWHSFGYGAKQVNLFPLENGAWLETTLNGSDEEVKKLCDHAMGSNELGLTVIGEKS